MAHENLHGGEIVEIAFRSGSDEFGEAVEHGDLSRRTYLSRIVRRPNPIRMLGVMTAMAGFVGDSSFVVVGFVVQDGEARYICSAKMARTIWCEKVIFESDSLVSAVHIPRRRIRRGRR